jgi:hypothetical protein
MIESNHNKDKEKSLRSLARNLSIIQKLVDSYKLWHSFLVDFPKISRYTIGEKIDSSFVEIIELSFTAINLYQDQKIPHVQKAIIKLDLLKFFLQIAWETNALDNKKFILLSEKFDEIGKMLGGWHRQLKKNDSISSKS